MSEQNAQQQNYLMTVLKKDRLISTIPSIVSDKNKYYENTINAIRRDPQLLQFTYDQATCIRLVTEIEKLARVGLTIGGIRPQAYIISFKNKKGDLIPTTIPTSDGYKFIVTSGKNPLFSNVNLHEIYENDENMKLDEGNGIFENPISLKDINNRGLIIAYVFDGMMANGKRILKIITLKTIFEHKNFSKSDSIWNAHFKRMCEKTAYKHVLRDFIYICEGLANLDEIDPTFDIDNQQHDEKVNTINKDAFKTAAPQEETQEVKKKNETKKEKDIIEII